MNTPVECGAYFLPVTPDNNKYGSWSLINTLIQLKKDKFHQIFGGSTFFSLTKNFFKCIYL